jgi:DNA-binding transcriptional ArsR family regulator
MHNSDIRKLNGFLFALNAHYLQHLLRIYKQFDGDIELCIVLGEIAHYSAGLVFPDKKSRELTNDRVHRLLRGCNAHSISLSSGLPRETVRRKIKKLIEMGYVESREGHQLLITQLPKEELGEFSKETFNIFLSFIDELKAERLI